VSGAGERRSRLVLLLAVVLYLGLRGLALYAAFDQVALTNYELYPMGTLPKVLLVSGHLPLHLYYDNAAGQLVTGFLALPAYLALGETYLALKMVPLACGLGALLALRAFLRAGWGPRAGDVGALLWAVGPSELLFKYSLLASGNHYENLCFTALALACFYRLHTTSAELRGRWLLIAGFTAGLALFVFLGAIIPVGLCVLMHLGARGWLGGLRDLGRFGPALLLGMAPLLYLNLATQLFGAKARGAGFLAAKFGGEGNHAAGRVGERFAAFLSEDLPVSGYFGDFGGLSAAWPNWVFVLAFLLAWGAALPGGLRGALTILDGARRKERDPAAARAAFERMRSVPLVWYLPLAALAFALSDLRNGGHRAPVEVAGYRYFLSASLVTIALLGVFVARFRGRWALALPVLAGLTCAWNLRWIDFAHTGLGGHYAGYNFVQAARALVGEANELERPAQVAIADGFAPPLRRTIYRGIGYHGAQKQLATWVKAEKAAGRKADTRAWLAGGRFDLDALLAGYPRDVHADVARGAGEGLRTYARLAHGKAEAQVVGPLLAQLHASGHPLTALVAEGCAQLQDFPTQFGDVPRVLNFDRQLAAAVPAPLAPAFARGLGVYCGRLLAREIPAEERLLDEFVRRQMAPRLGPVVYEGLGWGLADGREEPRVTAGARALAPEVEQLRALVAGYAAALRHIWPADESARRIELLAPDLRALLSP
jgi:hypothetical protein